MKTINFPGEDDKKTGIGQLEFREIFHSWYDALVNFIYYRSGDISIAEDIVQETFLKIWEMKDEIRMSTVRPLLYTIASNLYINEFHHKNVTLKFANTYTDNKKVSESPEFEYEIKEFDRQLQKALAELSEKNRVVFLMNRIDDLTYYDIAKNLNISVKAVEKRMKKALAHLRKRTDLKF